MFGVKIPGSIQKEEDKTFIYENLFGLKWDPNSGIIAKIGYYLSRTWIHIRGNLDLSVFKNLNQLTPAQEAVVFEVIHSNVEYFKSYDSWHRKYFEPQFYTVDASIGDFLSRKGLSLDKFDVTDSTFLKHISSVGKKELLEKFLELKPQQIDQKFADPNLIIGAVVSGDIETIQLLIRDKRVDLTVNCQYQHYASENLMDLIQHGYVKKNQKDVFITLYETNKFSLENASKVFMNSSRRFKLEDCKEILRIIFNENSDRNLVIKTFGTLLFNCLSMEGEHEKEKFFYFHRYILENFPNLEKEIIESCNKRIKDKIPTLDEALQDMSANIRRNKLLLMKNWFNSAIDVVRCEKDSKHLNDIADKLCSIEFMLESILETYQNALPTLIDKQKTEDEKINQLVNILKKFFERSGPSKRGFGDTYKGLKAKKLVFQGGIDKFDYIIEFMRKSHQELASEVIEKVRSWMNEEIKDYDAIANDANCNYDIQVDAEAEANIFRARLEWFNQRT